MNTSFANRGVTLIELMITLAIIAVLGAVAIPAYNNYVTTAKISDCQNEAQAIQTAQEEFFLTNNTYFGGGDAATLEANSTRMYTRTPEVVAGTSDCQFSVIAGSTGGLATSYTIVSTGANDLASQGELFRFGN